MVTPKFFDELSNKLSELAAASPARDLDKNIKALFSSALGRLDLVTREEFDLQREMLEHTRTKLTELETRISQLESEMAHMRTDQDDSL